MNDRLTTVNLSDPAERCMLRDCLLDLAREAEARLCLLTVELEWPICGGLVGSEPIQPCLLPVTGDCRDRF